MSYIRSTSNPEGLYAWATEDTVYLKENHLTENEIPRQIFETAIKKHLKNGEEDVIYKSFSIGETWEKDKFGVNLPKVIISYKDWSYTMWYVTWFYIIKNVK